MQRGTATLSLTLLGNAEVQAEGQVSLSGIRDTVDGLWLVQRVEHILDVQGFSSQIEAEVPNT